MRLAPYPDNEPQLGPGSPPELDAAGESECLRRIERVSQALRRTGHSRLHTIGVCVRDGVVFLEGRVVSFHLKQLAQESVRQVFNNAIIKNELEVTS